MVNLGRYVNSIVIFILKKVNLIYMVKNTLKFLNNLSNFHFHCALKYHLFVEYDQLVEYTLSKQRNHDRIIPISFLSHVQTKKETRKKKVTMGNFYLLRTWKAVNLCLGSDVNIFLTRSFAPWDIEGHGSLEKSMCPRKIALNIPFSDSANHNHIFL